MTPMASINVSEEDFSTIATAAHAAMDNGDQEEANALDKIARKINAALTGSRDSLHIGAMMGMPKPVVRWQDMPSVFEKP